MDNKKLIAILAVAIVVVSGVGVILTMDRGGSDPDIDYGGALMVYGNANGDSVIDSKDKDHLQSVIDGKEETSRFCDANHDDKIDADDIAYIDRLIAREEGLTVWYVDGGDFDASVTWPLNKINVLYRAQQTALAVGLDDSKVQIFCESDPVLYQRFAGAKQIGSVGLDDYDEMVSVGVPDAIITVTTPGTAMDPATKAIYDKAGIDIIRVANMEGYGTAATALTLGYLVDTVETSQKYAKWNTDMLNDIKRIVGTIPEKDLRTGQMWFGGYFASGVGHGYTKAMEFAGGVAVADWEGKRALNMEDRTWFYNYHPDYIIRTLTIGYSAPPEKGPGIYSTWAPVIEETEAYKAGHFCVIDSSLPQSLRIAYIGEFMYPEFYGEGYADNWHRQLMDIYGVDFEIDGQFIVTAEDMKNL